MIVAQLGDMQGQAQPAEVVGQLDGISAVPIWCRELIAHENSELSELYTE